MNVDNLSYVSIKMRKLVIIYQSLARSNDITHVKNKLGEYEDQYKNFSSETELDLAKKISFVNFLQYMSSELLKLEFIFRNQMHDEYEKCDDN